MEDEVWTTKDGRKIPVGEMDEEHVRNALRMVIRRAREAREKQAIIRALKTELTRIDLLDDWRR